MRIIINFLKIVFIFTVTLCLHGQSFFENNNPPRFGLIDRTDGLTSLSISSIQQDKYGFLWFGTQGGLSRFDGKQITSYTHDPFNSNSLPNDLVQTLFYEESENVLWIGTYGGLTRFNIDTGEFLLYKKDDAPDEGLSNNIVIAVSKDNLGNLWVGTMDGLNCIPVTGNKIQHIKTAHSTIRSLCFDSSGRLWVGSYGGLEYWDSQSQTMVTPDVDLPSLNVMSIRESETGRLLIGLWGGGVFEYWPDSNKTNSYAVPDNRIYTVIETQDGTLWAGSWGGGLWAKPVNGDPIWFDNTKNSELANTIIYSFFEDKGGLLWVGTNGGGVHYLSPRRHNYRMAAHDPNNLKSLAAGKIPSIYKRTDNNLYVGVDGEGLNVLNLKTGNVSIYKHSPDNPQSISSNNINFMLEDRRGNFWIATFDKLNLFDSSTQTFRVWPGNINPKLTLSHNIISNLMEDSSGRLWIGTYGHGIDIYDPVSETLVNYRHSIDDPGSLSDSNIYYILEKSDKTVWVSTNDGLNRFNSDNETFDHFLHREDDARSISGNNTRTLYEDSSGRLWIGTHSSGLNVYDSRQNIFFHFTTHEGLSSNNILAILEGKDHKIWVSTRGGINVIDPDTSQIEIIDERDGLFGVFFNPGCFKDEQEVLYFGGNHGITRIDSLVKNENTHRPDVHITGMSISGELLENKRLIYDGNSYVLPYNKNFLSFEFIALDYESPDHNQYQYMMEGLDNKWVDNGNRTFASYTNLHPGTYKFLVKASNNDQVWNDTGAYVDIMILSPLYKRWWAYLLYGVLVVGVLLMLWKYRESRLFEQKNRELEYANTLLEQANIELEKLSANDKLTGLYNRRYFDTKFEEEMLRAKRAGYPLSIMMLDVDRFKQFNDTYGHISGDKALETVAKVLKSVTQRNTDFVARYGGEEFVIVLFDTELEGAMGISNRIHEMLKTSEVLENQKDLRVTVSIGVNSSVPDQSCEPEEFIQKADQALYQAKHNGRARTEVFEE